MPVGFTTSFKLCTVASLPPISDPLDPPQVRLAARIIGRNYAHALALVIDPSLPAGGKPISLVVDLSAVLLHGGRVPPNLKDLVMIFGELVSRRVSASDLPRNELGFLGPIDLSTTSGQVLVVKRFVSIDEDRNDSFNSQDWVQAVTAAQSHLASR
ncbi:uncharacterized protein JCM15063_000699 [Sporobolomyces koalae]|uniref:uncharacterized protein n=1 Tax=Sporobolomyces koalae TaxID=500713 RepID=UPI0031705C10